MSTIVGAAKPPAAHTDPVNSAILAVSEDRIQGFHPDPFGEIARLSGVPLDAVLLRIRTMLEAGVIRRVRQTLLATNLAEGALVAWRVAPERLEAAFEWMYREDPFSGHVVLRSTDAGTAGSEYRLWTTLKVPAGLSMADHCRLICEKTGAEKFVLMPAKGIFALGVGHVRRRGLKPGDRASEPANMRRVGVTELNEEEWCVLLALKRELDPGEISADPWTNRAVEIGMDCPRFLTIAAELDRKRVVGRFSTFLEHVKPTNDGGRVTRFNGLFHWAVPTGMEERAGAEVGRHEILTHCYWREAGPEFGNVNIMAVAHGTEKDVVLAHKRAIDEHLAAEGIPFSYTNVFWGGRSEIKPSEISPLAYKEWRAKMESGFESGLDVGSKTGSVGQA